MLTSLLCLGLTAAEPSFRHVVVDPDNPPDPHCKAAGDLDGDGHPDLTAASASGGGLWWYRYPDWSKHKIADGTFTTDMAVADVDGDGRNDVIIPSNDGLMVYLNPGGDPATRPWEAVNVSSTGARMHNVELADLTGNGQLDIVTRHQSGFGKKLGNAVHLWYQQDPRTFVHREFACLHGEGLALGDIDGDGLIDVVVGARWYRNPGDPDGAWTEHPYVTDEVFARHWTNGDLVIQLGDLDGDGKLEIVLSPSEGKGHLSMFKAAGDPLEATWTEHLVAELDHAHGLALGDLNDDGKLDLVSAKMHQATAPQEVAVYWNQGGGQAFRKQVVATTGSHNIALTTVAGQPAIYGANWNSKSSTHGTIELWVRER